MEWEFIIKAILGILGAALIAGGIVMYRRSTTTGVRALGAAFIAAGVVMWAFIIFTTPVLRASGLQLVALSWLESVKRS